MGQIGANMGASMTFGKRLVPPPRELTQAEKEICPHCQGAGAIRGRGQRKVCLPCKGTGKVTEPS